MKKTIIPITAVAILMFTGCYPIPQGQAEKEAAVITPIETPEPTKTTTPTPAPTETPEPEKSEESTIDPLEDLAVKIAGVWGTDDNFFQLFDGTTIKRGWFGSDALPDAQISQVKELSENKYEVYVEDRGVIEDEGGGFEYEGQDYTVIIDGSDDGFKKTFIQSTDEASILFVKMGNTFEEAEAYSWEGFSDDFRELNEEIMGVKDFGPLASGRWYTDGYDEFNNWAGSYKIELSRDGKATCFGWRNNDSGTYEITGPNSVKITFDHCEVDSPGEGWVPVEGFIYTIDMIIDGDVAQIKIDAPDVISNLEDGIVHRK